ncbi:MAG: hypothetical protein ABI461_12080 [Polyangiaceae bacterium]
MSGASLPPSRSPTGPLSVEEIVAFFMSSVGEEKARDVVHAAVVQLHLAHKLTLDRTDALALLDHLAADPGIVGVAARFAKARTLLRKF